MAVVGKDSPFKSIEDEAVQPYLAGIVDVPRVRGAAAAAAAPPDPAGWMHICIYLWYYVMFAFQLRLVVKVVDSSHHSRWNSSANIL